MEYKSEDDWVSSCKSLNVGIKSSGRGKKTWGKCMRQDLDSFDLKLEQALDCYVEELNIGQMSNLCISSVKN